MANTVGREEPAVGVLFDVDRLRGLKNESLFYFAVLCQAKGEPDGRRDDAMSDTFDAAIAELERLGAEVLSLKNALHAADLESGPGMATGSQVDE